MSSLASTIKHHAAQSGRDLGYIGAMLCSSVIAFCVWVTALSVTISLLVFIVGAFVWLGSVYAFRWTTWIDRRLAGWIRREQVAAVYRRPQSRSILELLRCVTTDPQTWKDLGWLVLHSVLGFALSIAALTVTVIVLGYILMPAWWWAIPDPTTQYGTLELGFMTVESTGTAFIVTGIGLLLAPLVLLLNRGVVLLHSGLAVRILAPSESQRLRARVDDLAASRAGAVEAAQDQLERIERDLHDGAQARLVGLAMELGMAEEELEKNPDAAVETVRRARDETLLALGELRDLSRGLRPALLEERGLGPAVEALVARSPQPVSLSLVGSMEEIPQPVSSAAYFVVAEATTNAAKHSGSERVRVRLERADGALAISVEDDGRGGADGRGSGLEGLRKRVAALDGRLEVISPEGGPTAVRAVLPCG
ncbi:MAG TPA: sensor domain-containing protein [Solirubrobacterales bacterium]|nr:sensor domain-containing protein [Solirubrobacterales bacterium]